MGKGSTRRPAQVPNAVIESNWERTFGKHCAWCNSILPGHEVTCRYAVISPSAPTEEAPSKEVEVRERARALTQEMEKNGEYETR